MHISWKLYSSPLRNIGFEFSKVSMSSPSPFCCEDAACTAAPSRGNEDFRFYPLRVRLKFEVVGDYKIITVATNIRQNTVGTKILIG